MKIEKRTVGSVTILTIDGDILITGQDITPIADEVRHLLEQGHTRLLLDLGHVQYVDSRGLGELVHAFSAVRNRGGALKLMNVTPRIADLLIVTRLSTVFECFASQAEAMASFERAERH